MALMKDVFANEIEKLMKRNKNVVVLNADLAKAIGFGSFNEKFPERSINVGVAEQNMASIAAGMASYGFLPFICTFTPFATRRICDQIAVSICYANQNVKIVGADPGISAEFNGGTHMSVEDIGVLRSIPNIVIVEPADTTQIIKLMPEIMRHKGPLYIRLFRKERPDIYANKDKMTLFKAKITKGGTDVSIFCSGIMVHESLEAEKILAKQNVSAEIINIHTIKPIDKKTVLDSVKKTGAAVTAENHNIRGGLFATIAEVTAKNCPVPIESIGIPNEFGQVGKMPYLKEVYKMRAEDIAEAALKVISRKK